MAVDIDCIKVEYEYGIVALDDSLTRIGYWDVCRKEENTVNSTNSLTGPHSSEQHLRVKGCSEIFTSDQDFAMFLDDVIRSEDNGDFEGVQKRLTAKIGVNVEHYGQRSILPLLSSRKA